MKKLSGAVAFGIIGLCILGFTVRGLLAPHISEPEVSGVRNGNDSQGGGSKPSYQFESPASDGSVKTVNSTREVKATIDPVSGILVQSTAGDSWSCRIRLDGVGRSSVERVAMKSQGPDSFSPSKIQFAGISGGVQLTEWFKSGVHGVEQGWTLDQAPESAQKDSGEPLKLRLAVESGLLPQLTGDQKTIVFREVHEDAVGGIELRYQNLKAFDADGKAVPAWFALPEAGGSAVDILVADAGAVYPLTVDPCFAADSADKQFGSDTDDFDDFGHAIAVSGDWAAVSAPGKTDGSNDGRIYLFNKDASGLWMQTQSITTITGSGNSNFGNSVDMVNDLLVVGSPSDGNDAGGAHYIYRRNPADAWIQINKTPVGNDDGIGSYGTSVSIVDHPALGGAIAVGAPTGSGGTVFIYKENQGGTNNWGFTTSIQPSFAVPGFGSHVSIDSKTSSSSEPLAVAVGASGGEFARFFEEDKSWSEELLIPSSVSETVGQVVDLDINGNLIAVGAGSEGAGFDSVILFSSTTNGIWLEEAVIFAPVDSFGVNIALNGSTLAIYGYNSNSTGQPPHDFIYLHEEDEGGAGNWGLIDTITQPDLLPSGANDNEFGGGGLALTDDDLVVGAVSDTDASDNMSTPLPAGAAYFIPTEVAVYDFVGDEFSVVEGDGGSGAFSVIRTGCIDEAGAIEVAVNPGTVDPATFDVDYSSALILVSFAAGESIASVDFGVLDDAIFEADETVSLSFKDITGDGEEGTTFPVATLTIENDDSLPVIEIDDISVAEDGGQVDFVISVTGESAFDGTVDIATANGSATAGSDYVTRSATVTIPSGSISVLASVVITDDSIDEPDETFTLTLSNSEGLTIEDGASVGTATITDDDAPSSISIADVGIAEDGGIATFNVTLSGDSAFGRSVDFATADGSAVAGDDYTADSGTLTIPAGETSATINVAILDDAIAELTAETFTVVLSNPINATIADGTGLGTITDDDGVPTVSVDDVTVAEDGIEAVFTLTISGGSATITTVNYATADGTATAGSDYTATSGTATFPIGAASTTVTVPVTNDLLDEADTEAFTLELSDPVGLTIADGTGVGTITDNDAPPVVAVGDVTVDEGGEIAVFAASITGGSTLDGSVSYVVTDGTALVGSDYTATSGTLTIPAGSTSLEIEVPILDDDVDEADSETFTLTLSQPVNVTISDALGTGTISDDDDAPTVAIADVTVAESGQSAVFAVTVTGESAFSASVSYATADGTATAGSDYTATNGTLSIPAGTESLMISVPITDDVLYEDATETFTVTLGSADGVTISDGVATGTISDDEEPPSVSVADVTVAENGESAVFVVTVTGDSAVGASVDYATSDGTATAGSDYTAASGTLSIPAGTETLSIPVTILNDAIAESLTETFTLTLSEPSGVTISDGVATGTITDDEDESSVTVADTQAEEGSDGIQFVLTVSGVSDQIRTVAYETVNGSAIAGSDYVASSGTATIPAGQTSTTIDVSLIDDAIDELDSETFTLLLSEPQNLTIQSGEDTATATILDDDAPPTVAVSDVEVAENGGNAVFILSLTGATDLTGTVAYATADGSATAGTDYTATSGVATFSDGVTTVSVSVPVLDDSLSESGTETFTLVLSEPANLTIADGTGTGSITDNDAVPTVSVADASVSESGGNLVFAVTIAGSSSEAGSVSFATSDGTATAGSDYTAVSGSLDIPAGTTNLTVTVPVLDDQVDEVAAETLTLTLSEPVGVTIASASATGTIQDNDEAGGVTVADVTVSESAGQASFVISVNSASEVERSVSYATADGTATAGSDYVASSGTATFPAGVMSTSVLVEITNDTIDEAETETFDLILSDPVNLTIESGADIATATITDDDEPGVVSVGNVQVAENAGQASFVLTIAGESSLVRSVSYATVDGTATAGEDYTASSGVATFPVGTNSVTVEVPVLDDTIDEADEETFDLVLSEPVNVTIESGADTGTATITDDDAPPSLAIGNVEIVESGAEVTFQIAITGGGRLPVSVGFATSNGSAIAGSDYTAASGTLNIPAGQSSADIVVAILDDALDEDDAETFTVTLSDPVNAVIGTASAMGTILDDDEAPAVTIADASATEGNGASIEFTVSLSAVSGRAVTVELATESGTAVGGADFTTLSDSITIDPGASSGTFAVTLIDDSDREFTEEFSVNVTGATNATVGNASSATGTVLDDDGGLGATLVFVSGSIPAQVNEPDQVTPLEDGDLIQVGALGVPSDLSSFVVFGELAVTTEGGESGRVSGQVTGTFADAAQFTGKSILLRIYNAPTPEQSTAFGIFEATGTQAGNDPWVFPATMGTGQDDTVTLATGNLSNAPFAGFGSVTVEPDNVVLSVGGLIPEVKFTDLETGDEGTGIAATAFSVLLSEATTHTVIVDVSTADGSATAGADYEAVSQKLIFAPGETEKTVMVDVILDSLDESVESFVLEATEVVNAKLQGDGMRFSSQEDVVNPASGQTFFGIAVALDGDTMVVGSPLHEEAGVAKGAVFIFERSVSTGYSWMLAKTLTAADGASGDGFGESVALDGGLLVVGAPEADRAGLDSGAAYLFSRDQGGLDQWGLVSQLLPDDSIANDNFGSAVAASIDCVAVSARFHDVGNYPDDDGAVYIFARDSGGQDAWGLATKLTEDTQSFGSALAMDDDRVLVGARDDDAGEVIDAGAAFLYERNLGGADAWGLRKRFDPSTIEAHASFGYAVALESEIAVVSTFKSGMDESGRVDVYSRNSGGAESWGVVATLLPPSPVEDGLFGRSVAVSGDLIAVGETGSNSVNLFQRSVVSGAWELMTVVTDPAVNPSGNFGRTTAIWAGSLVTGLPEADGVSIYRDNVGIGLLNDGPASAGFSDQPQEPAVITSVVAESDAITILWQSHPDSVYTIQQSNDLLQWSDLATEVLSSGSSTTFRDRSIGGGSTTVRFYRVIESR